MSKQLLDFKGFKKVAEDKHTATMAHPDGHNIKIVKSALTPGNKMVLSKLPLHQSDPVDEIPESTPSNTPDVETAPIGNSILSGDQGGDATSPNNAPPTPEGVGAAQATASGAMEGTPQQDPYSGAPGYDEQKGALEQEGAAKTQQGSSDTSSYQQAVQADQKAQADLQKSLSDKMNDINQVTQDIHNNHINPNQYLENMSAGHKISTAIGLFLGGVGSGVTGQPNPAMAFLNSQIERDLNAQRANSDNKTTLLGALERQYGNQIVAANMFKAIRSNTLANQLGQAAATAQGPMAQAQAQQGIGQLKQSAGQYMRQAQLMQMRNDISGQAPGPAMDARASQYIQAANNLDPKASEDFQKHYVPGVGVASIPMEPKDRELLQKKTELKGLLDRASTFLGSSAGTGLPPITPTNRADAGSLQKQINLKMGELSDLTRFTPEENKLYSQAVPDLTGTHFTNKDKTLLGQLQQSNNNSLNTLYNQHGINTTANANDMVTVISPKGVSGRIPSAQLTKAMAQGYKKVGQ